MDYKIPKTMEKEHEELHAELRKATTAGGATGKTAKRLAGVVHPHFVKEEDFALPPLGLLPSLSKGKVTSDMKDILLMTDKLKTDLNQMLKEHEEIVALLEELVTAARKERKLKYARFADRLTLHAQTEEEVYYPAAILIGEYLKLKLADMNAKKSRKRMSNKKPGSQKGKAK
ncbi:MAG: hemerythrin domain-containing protein [Candidatus Bathyarchaeia archaeon]|jgi:hypothetical protein